MDPLAELLTTLYGARIVTWAQPTDDGEGEVYEAVIGGRLVRADSGHLLLRAVAALRATPSATRPALRLAA